MNYILSGNGEDIAKIIKENRIRVNRGLVSFTPMTETVKSDNSEVIANLTNENEALKAENLRLQEELKNLVNQTTDNKDVEVEDLKEVDLDDNKDVIPDDTKDVSEDDEKEVSADDKAKSSKRTKK